MTTLIRSLGILATLLGFVLSLQAFQHIAHSYPYRISYQPLSASPPPLQPVTVKKGRKTQVRTSLPAPALSDSPFYDRLPYKGPFRFAAVDGAPPAVGPNGGRLDAFGNEWVAFVDPDNDWVVAWKVYLSTLGKLRWGPFIGERNPVFVGPFGQPR